MHLTQFVNITVFASSSALNLVRVYYFIIIDQIINIKYTIYIVSENEQKNISYKKLTFICTLPNQVFDSWL